MEKQEKIFLKRLYVILTGMCLLILCVLLIGRAMTIQDLMIGELSLVFDEKFDEIMAINISEETDQSVLMGQYQLALAETSPDTSYPYYGAGILQHRDGYAVAQTRNMLIATFRDRDGNYTTVPMAFTEENDADVGELMFRIPLGGNYTGDDHYAKFGGFWKNGLFYLDSYNDDYAYGYSALVAYGDEEYEEIGAGADYDYTYLKVEKCIKSFGAEEVGDMAYRFGDYLKGWEKTDALTRKLIAMNAKEGTRYSYYVVSDSVWVEKNSLFQTLLVGVESFSDRQAVYGEEKVLKLVYGMEFSPLGLAAEEIFKAGTVIYIVLFFLFGGVVITLMYNRSVMKQMQDYRDEIHRQEQALSYAKDAEKSRRDMTSAIAHELKTPIAVLSSYAQALQENIDSEKQDHYLSVIQDETEKMDRMVLELLDYSRLEAGKYKLQRENFDLLELAKEILKPLEPEIEEKHLDIQWISGEVLVNADKNRMGQVIENYMTNAIRHTPEGGRIILRVGVNKVTFSVENEGEKIPHENLSKVWDTFWQGDSSRNQRGSGLGLSIVKSIMQLHGGSCKVENTGGGVRFSVNLTAETRQPVARTMPKEDRINLEYPIAQEYTTVKRMFQQLGLLEGSKLRKELKAGTISCGGIIIKNGNVKLRTNYVVLWKEYAITVVLDNDTKRRALIMNQFQPTGRLGNFAQNVGAYRGTGQ